MVSTAAKHFELLHTFRCDARRYTFAPATCYVSCAIALLLLATTAAGADRPELRAGGLAFGDYYVVPQHHLADGDGASGLVLRRGYLTFDGDFSARWVGKLRFELNQSGDFETYDFRVQTKDLYAGLRVGRHQILFGKSSTPTFDLVETIWGARYLIRTPLDLQGLASRDTGVAAQGPLADSLRYRVMVGSGVDQGVGTGNGLKWMGALTWLPTPNWHIDAYLDHERRQGPFDRTTFELFAGYLGERTRLGLLYAYQDRQDDPKLEVASAFAVLPINRSMAMIGRIDRLLAPSPVGDEIAYLPFDPSARATLFVAGLEFHVAPRITITPNVVVNTYDENDASVRPQTDLYLRLTLFFNFEGR